MRINHEKTEVMMFYETPPQRATRFPSTLHIITRFPPSQPPRTLFLKKLPTFKYLGLTLDPYLTMESAMKHICRKINAAHQKMAAVAHSLRYDSSRHEIQPACILPHMATLCSRLCNRKSSLSSHQFIN